jgi:cell fate regulator YaaT (PSP1 superfamily)
VDCRRGERVVVRTVRGVEIGTVLREATPRHAGFLPNTTVGPLLRRSTPDDEAAVERQRVRAQELFDRARTLTAELGLALEVLDVELLLDGKNAVLQHLRFGDCDVRELVSTCAREFDVTVQLTDLTRSDVPAAEEEHGCGSCGSKGGCGSCGSGGCGSCGTAQSEDVRNYFADLRERMERQRVPLL